MSREQQIEEMAEDLRSCHEEFNSEGYIYTDYDETAKEMIAKGYRKQSGWISVDERLPKNDDRVLVYLHSERSYTMLDTDRMLDGKWVRWGEDVTHWMPMPEPPERKEQP